ncbi:unnamed protein product, partial [Urochloa humidicola]
HNIGFIDPDVVYEDNVKRKSCDVVDLIYRNLRKNSMCPFILLPYCHHFHWILFAIEIEYHRVWVYDSLRQKKEM